MRHNVKGRKLGRNSTHKKAMIKNLATSLFQHGSVRTTLPKAKEARPYAEKLITRAISGTLADKRLIIERLNDKTVAHHLINNIAPKLVERKGGYLRIVKLGNREGDGAPMAVLEIVTEAAERAQKTVSHKKSKKAKKTTPSKAEIASDAAPESEKESEDAEDKHEEAPHEHEKTHPREEQTKEHLTDGSKAEGTRRSSKPPKKSILKQTQLHGGTSHPKTPPPASQES